MVHECGTRIHGITQASLLGYWNFPTFKGKETTVLAGGLLLFARNENTAAECAEGEHQDLTEK